MYAASAPLRAALEGPGPDRAEVWGELWRDGIRLATVEVVSGQVTDDASAAVRRSCSVVLPSLDGLTPETSLVGVDRRFGDGSYGDGIFGDYRRRQARGLLLPLKTQLRLFWRGLLPGTDTWETVPLGRFTVGEPSFDDSPDGDTVTVSGMDASSDIAAALWEGPFVIEAGTNVGDALRRLLTNRLPGIQVLLPDTDATTPQLVFTPGYAQGGNPWAQAQDLAATAGWRLFVDRTGRVRANATGEAVFAAYALTDTGNALRFRQTPSAADLVNTVIVHAENSGEVPVTATVQDLDGPYGVNTLGRVIARELRSSGIKTAAEAQNAGIALLRHLSALTETVELSVFPSPHYDAGDIAAVSSQHLELDDDLYAVDRVVFSLDLATPTAVTVSRRLG